MRACFILGRLSKMVQKNLEERIEMMEMKLEEIRLKVQKIPSMEKTMRQLM